jgi:hypothetical protein
LIDGGKVESTIVEKMAARIAVSCDGADQITFCGDDSALRNQPKQKEALHPENAPLPQSVEALMGRGRQTRIDLLDRMMPHTGLRSTASRSSKKTRPYSHGPGIYGITKLQKDSNALSDIALEKS